MIDGEQLGLEVETLQPDEAYLLYTEVKESWDSTCYELKEEDDCYGGKVLRENRFPCRGGVQDKLLTGVIVDDLTLEIIKGRMEEHAAKWKSSAHEQNEMNIGLDNYRPNFEIEVTYSLEKIRRIVLAK